MNFASDNVTGAAAPVLEALVTANDGTAASYGEDAWTKRVESRLASLFERDVTVFPVATGTAANALSLACLVPPWGAVLAHEDSHIERDECGAPEFYTGGAKLIALPGAGGKLTPDGIAQALERYPIGWVHTAQPAALSLTEATEQGTVYTPDEIAALTGPAKRAGLRVHMDGARFANAVAHLRCAPADITWRAGVDVLSLGATKNGCLGAEAVVFFDAGLAESFAFRRKRAGHLFSKLRFISAQLDAWLDGGLWLDLAARANASAARLAAGLTAIPGITLAHPCEANGVFAEMDGALAERLLADGARFYRWEERADGRTVARFMCAFSTSDGEIDAFLARVRAHSEALTARA